MYLERHAPAAYAELERSLTISNLTAVEGSVFAWPRIDPEAVPLDLPVREADRYSLAYRLVRSIYDRDQGESLRALRAAFRRTFPRSAEQMEAQLRQVLGWSSAELLAGVKREIQEESQNRTDLGALKAPD
jgi:hypothetical protein